LLEATRNDHPLISPCSSRDDVAFPLPPISFRKL
jgi:hypothetical protein